MCVTMSLIVRAVLDSTEATFGDKVNSFDEWRFSACSITIMTRSTLIHGSCDDLRVSALRCEGESITGRSRMPVRGNDTLARQVRGNLGVYLPATCRSPPDAARRSPPEICHLDTLHAAYPLLIRWNEINGKGDL
ncbi:uncharacterized protein LOC123723560 [Papilio machaon]|uniref:uncharacterized protein LOC123723560 n=1 Tax=Papilio machaon TaxID=76193 RepID=UPI001E664C6C|nr:uncharacterized protein LOC123723560 [Papilio machaon]